MAVEPQQHKKHHFKIPAQSQDLSDFLKRTGTFLQGKYSPREYWKQYAIVAFDRSMQVIFMNQSSSRLLDLDNQNVRGKKIHQFLRIILPARDHPYLSPWEEMLRRGLLIGKHFHCQVQNTAGIQYPAVIMGSPLFRKGGELLGGVIFIDLKMTNEWNTEKLNEQKNH